MRMFRFSVRWLIFATLVILPVHGHAVAYSATELKARVVDAETHEPLGGVNVVAHWVLDFGLEGGVHADLMLMESVTDSNGWFFFPAWGPKEVPPELPWYTSMGSQDPEIVLFKSGYQWRALSMTSGPQQGLGPLVRTSRWNGQTIELKKFKGDPKVYAGTLSGVLTGVGYGGCGWKKIPRMIIALNNEDETLKR